jgi:hypothetical protein
MLSWNSFEKMLLDDGDVRFGLCGICGSSSKTYEGTVASKSETVKPDTLDDQKLDMTPTDE